MKHLLLLFLSVACLSSCSSKNTLSEKECQFACRNEAHKYEKKAPVGCQCIR